ncbi:hypothetical protein ACAG96_07120 [Candidatus Izemoplasma sp. B36]|uniref:hypothetical protein n=1 Tax=Candidatus Izemoplasma sp. B36 TaxID=3242468 RepID=UPI003557CC75
MNCEDKPNLKNIHMIYSVRHICEAIHLNELKQLDKENKGFSFSLFDTSKQGFITADDLGIDDHTTLYMCGPRPMVLAIKKQMKEKYPSTEIIYEAFSFTGTFLEDIIALIKKLIKRFKKKNNDQ